MALYDYGNTRLRARFSSLQSAEKLESLSDLTSIDSLISILTKTPYKEYIETALTFAHGYECVNQALKIASSGIYQDLMRFYQAREREVIQIIFFRNDLQNLKTIFRGILHKIPVDQIIGSFFPMGTISENLLKELVKSGNLDNAIALMAVYHLPVSEPLLRLRSGKKELSSSDIELAMEQWYFLEINKLLRGESEDDKLLSEYYQIEADIINLNTLLRFAGSETGHKAIGDSVNNYFINAGYIRQKKLIDLAKTKSVDEMIHGFYNTRYSAFLRKGLECFHSTNLISEFENQMRMYLLIWSAKLPRRFPLGVGVPLGYVALKKSEIKNLRWIAKGVVSGFKPSFIRENLERIQ